MVDTRLDLVEKMTKYKYLDGLPVRSVNSEYAFLYNAYVLCNNSDEIITNFFQAQLYASQITQASYIILIKNILNSKNFLIKN